MTERTAKKVQQAIGPHSESGVLTCPADLTFEELVNRVEAAGWSTDGIHPEPKGETIGALLQRRQPRPLHWCCGLLASRCLGIEARRFGGETYRSIGAPRKSAGPDLSYFFIGGEGSFGAIERASISTVRPALSYLRTTGQFDDPPALFKVARTIALLDPLSTRQLDVDRLALEAFVPVRQKRNIELSHQLEAVGLTIEPVAKVPTSARFITNALSGVQRSGEGCRLDLSAPYRAMAKLLPSVTETLKAQGGRIWLGYTDTHGLHATFGSTQAGFADVEKLYERIIQSGDFDDVGLTGEDGEHRSPTKTFLETQTDDSRVGQ